MRIVCISDTHGQHLDLPDGDVLCIAGDLTHYGSFSELKAEAKWLESLPHHYVILCAGNHDVWAYNIFQNNKESELREFLKPIIYLRDSGCEIAGVKFYGTPWVLPHSGVWDSEDMQSVCKRIQTDTNVLITHQPPHKILDGDIGCPALRGTVNRLPELQLHIFGHAEAHYGQTEVNGVTFCNAAMSTRRTDHSRRQPLIVEIPERASSARA